MAPLVTFVPYGLFTLCTSERETLVHDMVLIFSTPIQEICRDFYSTKIKRTSQMHPLSLTEYELVTKFKVKIEPNSWKSILFLCRAIHIIG